MGEAELRSQDEEPRSGLRAAAAAPLAPLRLALWPLSAAARLLYAAARGGARMATRCLTLTLTLTLPLPLPLTLTLTLTLTHNPYP